MAFQYVPRPQDSRCFWQQFLLNPSGLSVLKHEEQFERLYLIGSRYSGEIKLAKFEIERDIICIHGWVSKNNGRVSDRRFHGFAILVS